MDNWLKDELLAIFFHDDFYRVCEASPIILVVLLHDILNF